MPTSDDEPPATSAKKAAGGRKATKEAGRRAPAAKHQDRSNSRRNEIIRAAADTFYRKSYESTTTQEIAEAVGMLKGSLYYYISSKEDLLYEIINEVHEVWTRNMEHNEVLTGDPVMRIWVFVHNNVIGNASNLVNSAVFFREFGALTGKRREHIIALRDLHDMSLRELIRDGQAQGLLRADLDAKLSATAILTMCNALYHWYRPDGALTPESVAEAYADLAVAGLIAKPKLLQSARTQAQAAIARQ